MDTSDINKIIDAIGEKTSDDYKLQPQVHAKAYKDLLPGLSTLLQNDFVEQIAKEYSTQGSEAGQAQKKFKNLSTWARRTTFFAATFSATLIMAGSLGGVKYIQTNLPDLPQLVLVVSTVLTIVFSAATSSILMIIKGQRLHEKWMKSRAVAEEMRLSYFEVITDNAVKEPEMETQIAALEYFRRFLLDSQISYFTSKTSYLGKHINKTTVTVAVLAGLVLIINGITGFLGLNWTSLATIAIILQAYSSLINNRELQDKDLELSDRYEILRKDLSLLRPKISEVRRGVLAGNTEALTKYVKAVLEQLAAENRQWLETQRSAGLAIEELEEELRKIDNKPMPAKKGSLPNLGNPEPLLDEDSEDTQTLEKM